MSYDLSVLQDRRTATAFAAADPTPLNGQLCIESDTGRAKVGDGSTAYAALSYTALSGEERRSADDVYAAQQLSDARDDAGGGGGGGVEDGDTLAVGFTFPQNGLKTETPSGDTLSINANGTQTDDRTLSVDIGDSDKQLTITDDATISGTNTGDVRTLTTHWREWSGDEGMGGPIFPSTVADLMANMLGPIFDPDSNMGVRVALSMPSDYDGEDIEVVLKGTANAGNNGNDARLYCKAVVVNPSSNLNDITADGAIPTPNTVSMATIADGDAFASSFTITPSGDAWTSSSQLVLLMGRAADDLLDTHDESITLTNATINW